MVVVAVAPPQHISSLGLLTLSDAVSCLPLVFNGSDQWERRGGETQRALGNIVHLLCCLVMINLFPPFFFYFFYFTFVFLIYIFLYIYF